MSNKPLPQQIYRHFKGNLYRIVTLARHSETGEELVVYQALYGDYQVYARPLSAFFDPVDRVKYPDAPQVHRFELCNELIGMPKEGEQAESVSEGNMSKDFPEEKDMQDMPAREDVPSLERQEEIEELNIDPLVLEFLDADSYEERLNILAALHHRITSEMINTMAIAIDHEIGEGDTEDRYEELKNCLLTLERFECNRLR